MPLDQCKSSSSRINLHVSSRSNKFKSNKIMWFLSIQDAVGFVGSIWSKFDYYSVSEDLDLAFVPIGWCQNEKYSWVDVINTIHMLMMQNPQIEGRLS